LERLGRFALADVGEESEKSIGWRHRFGKRSRLMAAEASKEYF
jgi:hypothetical protein